jgi:hypothetical protein
MSCSGGRSPCVQESPTLPFEIGRHGEHPDRILLIEAYHRGESEPFSSRPPSPRFGGTRHRRRFRPLCSSCSSWTVSEAFQGSESEFRNNSSGNSFRRMNCSGVGFRDWWLPPEPSRNMRDALRRIFESRERRELEYRYTRIRELMNEAKRRVEITEEYDRLLRREWENLRWERERRPMSPESVVNGQNRCRGYDCLSRLR